MGLLQIKILTGSRVLTAALELAHNTKTEISSVRGGNCRHANRGPLEGEPSQETTTPDDTLIAPLRTNRVRLKLRRIAALIVPVQTPLPNIAVHVKQAE